ncbi:restriction endonuclease subunit S [Deinococcus sp. DB0503]|uniref:restriction endonuclease subunit S n=1 Tax=Deinococcus sp. DB0503 TaxID=2479203 RepID=UPI0018DF6554|nr:restriction endonuclease subunit S [Deinococcus sp. DB0503]MBI0445354.1 restriction endonuclease subunit S [Deinococcus sp. DB0503]
MPGEWRTKALGDVALFEMGQAPSSRFVSDSGHGYPFLQGNAEFGARSPASRLVCSQPTKLSQVNDVLISVRAPVGEVNVSDRAYAIGRGLAAIRFTHLTPDFGWHAVRFAAPELDRVAQGSTFAAIGKTELARLQIPSPPLPEQRRIAAILDTLDRTIEGTQRVIEKLQATRQGLLHDLLTRGLDERGQLRDPERNPEQFKETELGRVPVGWRELRLSDISTHITKGATPTTFGRKWADSGVLFLRSECVKDNEFSLSGAEFIDVVTHTIMGRSVVMPGDILMTITGYIGRSCVYPTGLGDANINQHIARVRVVHPDALPKFVSWQLQDIRQKNRLERDLTGLAYPQISLEQVRDIPVFLPRLDEQKRISSALDAAKKQVTQEEERLAKLQALKRGLMEDLLTGRVRVAVADAGVTTKEMHV